MRKTVTTTVQAARFIEARELAGLDGIVIVALGCGHLAARSVPSGVTPTIQDIQTCGECSRKASGEDPPPWPTRQGGAQYVGDADDALPYSTAEPAQQPDGGDGAPRLREIVHKERFVIAGGQQDVYVLSCGHLGALPVRLGTMDVGEAALCFRCSFETPPLDRLKR